MTTEQRRILVVEDDPEIGYLLSVILDEPDREVVTADSGNVALSVLEESEVHLVLLDLILPDIDGRAILTWMRERPETANTPVVVVSAQGRAEIREDCYDLGADAFIEKPFDPDELAADIAVRLERSAGRERDSLQDGITGLLNRAGLRGAASELTGGFCLALVQLDGFVTLSESWGWSEAEPMLKDVAAAISNSLGEQARAARIGGGEFALLVLATEMREAESLCEAVLEAVRSVPIVDPDGEPLRLTASIGVVPVTGAAEFEDALDGARRRLFRAREAGRNQVLSEDLQADLSKARVLVAEDDEISATILLHRLEKEGLDIVRFDNGKDAYEAALDETPNLVILDVKMPGMDGFEVLERLRRMPAYASVPIILLTSMGSEADVVRGFQLGADDYILKPFSPTELSARVWRLLRRGRSTMAV